MPIPPFASGSPGISSDLFDLDLPVVREDETPAPAPTPSYETMLAHARFLLESGLAPQRQPCPEPFILD